MPKRLLLLSALAALCPGSSLLSATPGSPSTPLPNFDRRAVPAPLALPAVEWEDDLDARIDRDPITGSPAFIGSWRGMLTAAGASAVAQSAAAAQGASLGTVKTFMQEHADLFGYDASVLASAVLKREYVTTHNGMRTAVWEQQLDGIPVFEGLLQANLSATGELINIGSRFVADATGSADRGVPHRQSRQRTPIFTARKAVAAAAANLGEQLTAAQVRPTDRARGRTKKQEFRAPGLNGATAQLVYLPMDAQTMTLCWQVQLTSKSRGEMYSVLIDTRSGEAQLRQGMTEYLSNASYRVYTSDSPTPLSPGLAIPSAAQPAPVARVLVTTPALNTLASPNGWIDDGVSETRGNNVDAHTDVDGDNRPDLPRPHGGRNRVFDFPLDLAQGPETYRDAAVVQLFYWCNFMHDKLYELGFTEAAGNFQMQNFGRGGVGGDAVLADAQDGFGRNNANFSTPSDGSPGRMQMFLFDGPAPARDGDLDAEIILHEYTHGLSNRLVGGGTGIRALQPRGMGEGWSDFYALALLSEPGDSLNGNYAAGAYAVRNLAGLQENYYFGVRRYPYSTDLGKSPLTFADIDPLQARAHDGVPISPIFAGSEADEVHSIGEVWCAALWEARAALIAKHGFAVGNPLILQLVTDGMKLAPANPNFLQARDAILQADLVKTRGANRAELWSAFAKRGLGASARSPGSFTTIGVVEAFDTPETKPPTAPGALSLTLNSAGGVRVEWVDRSADETGFEIERATDGATFALLTAAPANPDAAARIVDNAVTPGQRYTYRVRAVRNGLASAYSPTGSIDLPSPTPPKAPAAPGALTIYLTSEGGVRVEWVDNSSDETGFEVERGTDGANFALLTAAPANPDAAERIVDTAVTPGQRYYYRVRAVKGGLASGYSPSGFFDVPKPVVPPPTAPGALTIYLTSAGGVRVEWVDNSSHETGFEVERSTDGVNFALLTTAPPNTDDAERIVDTAVTPGQRYYYRVRAVKSGLFSGYSPSGFIDVPKPVVVPPPTAPGALTISLTSEGGVRVEWVDNSSHETGFEVERSTDGVNFALLTTAPPNTDAAERIVDTAVTPGQRYYYRVRAVKGGLVSGYSPSGFIDIPSPPVVVPPTAPGALTIYMTSEGGVRVEWVDNSSHETGFEVERSTDGVNFALLTTAPANTDAAERIVDTAVTPGQRYYYRVRAVKSGLVSGYSPVGSLSVPLPPPAAPGALTITMTSAGGVRVEWVDRSSDETGFEIQRGTDGTTFAALTTAPANPDAAARIVDTNIAFNRRYYYRVRAVRKSVESAWSPVGIFTTHR